MQTADKKNNAVYTWEENDSHSARISRLRLYLKHYDKKSEEVRQQDEKDFNLLVKINEVQIEHPYYGYRRIWREINKNGGDTILSITTSRSAWRKRKGFG